MLEPSSYNKYDDDSYGDKWSIGNKRIRTYVVNDHGQDHDFNKIKSGEVSRMAQKSSG